MGLVDAIRLDGTVLTFAIVLTILAGVPAGLFPAFRAADDGLAGTWQSAGRSGVGSARAGRLRGALVVGQFALAVVLLHAAGLLLHSFVRLISVDPGFRTERVLSFPIDLPPAAYASNERVDIFFRRLFEAVKRQSGVLSVGASHHLPIGGAGSFRSRFRGVEGRTLEGEEPSIGVRIVTPGYFQTIGVRVLQGRSIEQQDRAGGLPTVVINETAAARFFGTEDPIGKRLAAFSYDAIENAAETFTTIGVVADVRSRALSEGPQAEAYFAPSSGATPKDVCCCAHVRGPERADWFHPT
jgi:putative ABC transport system permease protein